MQLLSKIARRFTGSDGFFRSESGGMLVETAFGVLLLSTLMVGIIDFGLAYSRQMAMSNAVRAGVQLALVRHPSLDPSADSAQALTSINEIRGAVLASATFLESDPGAEALKVTLRCTCPDMTPIDCFPESGSIPPCQTRRTYVDVAMRLEYDMLVPIEAVGQSVTLSANNSIRLK